jgi:hypothetical protein
MLIPLTGILFYILIDDAIQQVIQRIEVLSFLPPTKGEKSGAERINRGLFLIR